jgi:HEAT repeat protein
VIASLESDHESVRVNACWTLGYLGPEAAAAVPALETAADNDDAQDVRNRAAWALKRIDDAV